MTRDPGPAPEPADGDVFRLTIVGADAEQRRRLADLLAVVPAIEVVGRAARVRRVSSRR